MLVCFRNGIQHGATKTTSIASNGNDNHRESEKNKCLGPDGGFQKQVRYRVLTILDQSRVISRLNC